MTIIASETDPTDWHGSMTVDKPLNEMLGPSLKTGSTFIVSFEYKGQKLLGLINVSETPEDMGLFSWIEFCGVDIFHFR
jgi:hypothetical protein